MNFKSLFYIIPTVIGGCVFTIKVILFINTCDKIVKQTSEKTYILIDTLNTVIKENSLKTLAILDVVKENSNRTLILLDSITATSDTTKTVLKDNSDKTTVLLENVNTLFKDNETKITSVLNSVDTLSKESIITLRNLNTTNKSVNNLVEDIELMPVRNCIWSVLCFWKKKKPVINANSTRYIHQ